METQIETLEEGIKMINELIEKGYTHLYDAPDNSKKDLIAMFGNTKLKFYININNFPLLKTYVIFTRTVL